MNNSFHTYCCHPSCPVRSLDLQSGDMPSGHRINPSHPTRQYEGWGTISQGRGETYADSGGASRFFKQVKDFEELISYLTILVDPPASSHREFEMKSYYLGPPLDNYESLMEDLLPGANVLVVSDVLSYHRVCCEVEDAGFELRDCITVLTPGDPLLIAVAMKPLDGTFVENALKHGVAGYNIDAGRIRVDAEDPNRRPNRTEESDFDDGDRVALNGALTKNTVQDEGAHHSKGRFPTNLILMHHPDCQCIGTKKVKPSNGSGRAYEGGGDHEEGLPGMYGAGLKYRSGVFGVVGEDGTETVDDWQCVDGCPVKALDEQTQDTVHGAGHARDGLDADMKPDEWNAVTYSGGWKAAKTVHRFGDVGGASRFFKQVVDEDALFEYLRVLVTPPEIDEDV